MKGLHWRAHSVLAAEVGRKELLAGSYKAAVVAAVGGSSPAVAAAGVAGFRRAGSGSQAAALSCTLGSDTEREAGSRIEDTEVRNPVGVLVAGRVAAVAAAAGRSRGETAVRCTDSRAEVAFLVAVDQASLVVCTVRIGSLEADHHTSTLLAAGIPPAGELHLVPENFPEPADQAAAGRLEHCSADLVEAVEKVLSFSRWHMFTQK